MPHRMHSWCPFYVFCPCPLDSLSPPLLWVTVQLLSGVLYFMCISSVHYELSNSLLVHQMTLLNSPYFGKNSKGCHLVLAEDICLLLDGSEGTFLKAPTWYQLWSHVSAKDPFICQQAAYFSSNNLYLTGVTTLRWKSLFEVSQSHNSDLKKKQINKYRKT